MPHKKRFSRSANPIAKIRRKRSWERGQRRKDEHVRKSSKGKFASVAALEAHRMERAK